MLTRVRGIQKLTTPPILRRVFEGAFPEGVDHFERVAPDGDDERRADSQGDGDGQEQEGDSDGERAWILDSFTLISCQQPSFAFSRSFYFKVIFTRCQALFT